jgi:magnesium-transporting ATPase (P-type)
MAAEYPKHPFLLTVEETAQALGTSVDKGLTSQAVSEAQAKYPKNELDVGESVAWYKIMTKQVLNAMIIVSFPSPFTGQKMPFWHASPGSTVKSVAKMAANSIAISGPGFCHGS